MYEFVEKGDPPVMGITQLGNGVTAEDLKRPRRQLNEEQEPTPILDTTTDSRHHASTSA